MIDTRHITQRAGEACLLFAIEEIESPIVMDWRWKYVEALDRLAADHRCRIIISNEIDLNVSLKLTSSDTHLENLTLKFLANQYSYHSV